MKRLFSRPRYLPARWPILLMLLLLGCAGFTNQANAAPQQPWMGEFYYGNMYQDYYSHTWRTQSSLNVTVGLSVDLPFRATVSDPSISFATAPLTVATGHLPPGLSLSGSNGDIVGAPTQAGDYSCTILVSQIRYAGLQFPDQTVTVRIIATGN